MHWVKRGLAAAGAVAVGLLILNLGTRVSFLQPARKWLGLSA